MPAPNELLFYSMKFPVIVVTIFSIVLKTEKDEIS
jgi:hypothetical protein